jgi:hypothetical protein
MSKTYHIFLGYDDREHEAFQVAKYSLEKRSSVDIKVHKLSHKELREKGLLYRPSMVVGHTGQYVDAVDGRPFSTQFTFSRFLLPEIYKTLEDKDKSPLVMFADSDFLFLDDIGNLFKLIEDQKLKNEGESPLYCVQHNYNPQSKFKMDNVEQHTYNMKLWAALMVFDMDNIENQKLNKELVNTSGGRDLMHFYWIDDPNSIGNIPERWQYIPNHSEKNTSDPIAALHWTEGGPYFKNHRDVKYSRAWFDEYDEYLNVKLGRGQIGLEEILDGE